MTDPVVIYKRRTNILPVVLNQDVSIETFVSEVRRYRNPGSLLLATWTVTVKPDGKNRTLILTLTEEESSVPAVTNAKEGWMDIKRTSGDQSIPVFNEPVAVVFRDQVTS